MAGVGVHVLQKGFLVKKVKM